MGTQGYAAPEYIMTGNLLYMFNFKLANTQSYVCVCVIVAFDLGIHLIAQPAYI
jgi:hypothetical protein